MIWLICILWLGSSIPYWESIFHVYESLSSWIDDCSNTGNHPMFWPRIQTICDQTPDPFERVPHSCPDLGVAKLRCESWAKLIFPNFPQLDMREPTVFLAPWGHRELPLTQLTSVIASERMKITNAHSQRRNHSQRSMWPKYIYNFYIDLHRFTMIYQPSSISAQ